MRRKWILMGLAVGLLVMAITGGVALAWGGGGHGWGWFRGDHDDQRAAVAAKVAETLGTDEQETADAITQAQAEVRDEAADAALQDFAGRVADTLGTDADTTAKAIKQAAQDMRSEALETRLQDAIDNGDMTEDEAQEIRDRVADQPRYAKGLHLKGGDAQDLADRVAETLEVEGDDVAAAMTQAKSDIRSEALEERLQAAIDSGRITEDEADEIRDQIDSGDWDGFGKRGRHGRHDGDGRRGRGRHGHRDSDSDPTATPAPASDGDST